jgi:hypothetical protein
MLTADDLHRVYATYMSAIWRGDPASLTIETWLTRHWRDHAPIVPSTGPVAVNPHGAGGHGIYWHESASVILGVVPGRTGCYLVKRTEQAPPTING